MCVKPIVIGYAKHKNHFGHVVPCGFCLQCRSRYAGGWAIRCVHEASMHAESCFGTLTYDDAHLPEHGSLKLRDFQLFMKRLRKFIAPRKVRFYHAGEYGEINHRPHYHFLIFGYMPGQLDPLPYEGAYPLYRSPELEKLWPSGLSSVGHVSIKSARYVANYVMKKAGKVGKRKRYSVDPKTGEAHEIEQEYSTMSRGGDGARGLGYTWFRKYGEEVERLETVRVEGDEYPPPRYYDSLIRERDEAAFAVMKLRRMRKHGERMRKDDRGGFKERLAKEVIARRRLEDIQRRL